MGDVIAPSKFASRMSDGLKASLESYGMKLAGDDLDKDLDLVPLQPEERVVGNLLASEADLLAEVVKTKKEMDFMMSQFVSRHLISVGERVRSGELAPDQAFQPAPIMPEHDEEAHRYFEAAMRHQAVYALFHWTIGERLHMHDWRLGVRAGGRIVAIERRW